MLNALKGAYPAFQGDPFLESTYWEITANLQFQKSLRAVLPQGIAGDPLFNPSLSPSLLKTLDLKPTLSSLQMGLARGFPAAHLYYELGTTQAMAGMENLSRLSFQKALKAPLNFTKAQDALNAFPLLEDKQKGLK